MRRPQPRSTRTDTLFPYTTLFRSAALFAWLNRGKRSMALAREAAEWAVVLEPLVRRSDILITDLDDEPLAAAGLSAVLREASAGQGRSEERRVGKEWVSTGRSRWSQDD